MFYSSQSRNISPDTFCAKAIVSHIHYLSEQLAHPSNIVFYTTKAKSWEDVWEFLVPFPMHNAAELFSVVLKYFDQWKFS